PLKNAFTLPDVLNVSLIDDNTGIFAGAYADEDVGGQANLNNLETTMNEPKKVIQALEDPSWIEGIQEELLRFKLQKVWTLVDLPNGKRAIRTKWVFRNKKDERGIVVRNKVRLVAQGYTQEEGINYDEMDVKSVFLYGTIEEEVYVCQPPSFEDPHFPDKVYKVEKSLYGLHQPRGFDVDFLSKTINYLPVVVGNQTNGIVGTRDNIVASQAEKDQDGLGARISDIGERLVNFF
ncbi:putative ribonuclease H-like domain-containing protein, partial [Tanacetum coccineum]